MNLAKTLALYEELQAAIGLPGERIGPLHIQPMPKNDVPSLKKNKRQRVPTDEELDALKEEVQPDQERLRKKYRRERIGKSGGMQVW